MIRTIRFLQLWKIESNAVRRVVILFSFPLFFAANLLLFVLGLGLWWWKNQVGLFVTTAHYWNTSRRYTDT